MNRLNTRWMMIASLAAAGAVVNVGCGSDSTPAATDAGTGGRTGGTGGRGGSTTDSGTDVQVVHMVNYTFDSTVQGWVLNTYPDPTSRNLAGVYPVPDGGTDAAATDAGAADAGAPATAPTLTFDSVVGDPAAGSLKISVTFTDCGQYVDPVITLPAALNLTGKTLHARLDVASGTFSGGAQLHASTGANYDGYASAQFVLAASGTFATTALDFGTTSPPVNPAMVVQLGVQIYSGTACTATVPAVPYPNIGVPVVFNIDTVTD